MCSDARIEYRHRWIKQRIRTLAYGNSKSTAERTWNGDDMIRWLTMLNRGFHISDYGMLALSSFTSHWRQSVQHSYVHASARKSGHDGWNRFPVIGCFLGWTFIEILQDICLREVGVTISTLWMILHRSLDTAEETSQWSRFLCRTRSEVFGIIHKKGFSSKQQL